MTRQDIENDVRAFFFRVEEKLAARPVPATPEPFKISVDTRVLTGKAAEQFTGTPREIKELFSPHANGA